MEKNKTLKEVYKNSSDEVKEILKSKFNNEDLGIEPIKTQIRDEILEIIKKNIRNIRFLHKNSSYTDLPTSRFMICNENGDWLFDINYNEKTKHFWYSYLRIFEIFESKYGINSLKFNEIMRGVVEEDLKMEGVTPRNEEQPFVPWMEEDLKMEGVTPYLHSVEGMYGWKRI